MAAVFVAIPHGWCHAAYRLVGISLLIVWHFFALYTATQIVAPPTGPPSWLASQVWTRITRPYLQITHLNNAYHFYAPEPGPVAVMWFRVRFADGAVAWERPAEPSEAAATTSRKRRRSGGRRLGAGRPSRCRCRRAEEQIRLRDEAGRAAHRPARPATSAGDAAASFNTATPAPWGR